MNEILQQIDRLFAEDVVPLDRSGRLARVAKVLAQLDPCLLFLADYRGRLIAVHEEGLGGDRAETPVLAQELAGLLVKQAFHVGWVHKNGSALLAFGQRLTDADSAVLGGLLRSSADSEPQLRGLRSMLEACGVLAWEAFSADGEIDHLTTRIRHLAAEQDTIKMAHGASVATVIEEREARIREQRDYVVHLEEEVSNRSAALREAMERAEDANRSKSEFLANMSHEIRTPMTAILGFADMLLEPELSREELDDAIQTIRRNGKYLLEIINDILDLSKVEAGKIVVEQIPCSPTQIISDVVDLLRVRAEEKHLTIDVECVGSIPETVCTDPTRLRQILINIVGNAVKFTNRGSIRLVTRLVTDDKHSPLLQFDIIDTGVGMTQKETTRLFQPFSQADSSTTRKFGGTGLGLALAKRLAHVLGGDVTVVETAPGAGTRVRVTIGTGSLDGVRLLEGISESTHPCGGMAPPSSNAGGAPLHCRILLAEDRYDNQRLISHLLRKDGAEVAVVDNGQRAVEEALAACEQGTPFDVILMDMQMPLLDGYEATQLLRSKGYAGRIVALTAHTMVGDRDKCLAVGCDGYTTKPIDRQRLVETLLAQLPIDSASRSSPSISPRA